MKLDKKRRLENKTNYRKRLILLKGLSYRFVIRKTNRYIIIQLIESKDALDKVIYSVNTKDLLKHGWPQNKEGSLKSIPASYLGGYLLGKKAKDIKSNIIPDLGLIPGTKGSRVYAVIKGVSDAGLKIKYDEKIMPTKDMIEGKHTSVGENIFNKVKGAIK